MKSRNTCLPYTGGHSSWSAEPVRFGKAAGATVISSPRLDLRMSIPEIRTVVDSALTSLALAGRQACLRRRSQDSSALSRDQMDSGLPEPRREQSITRRCDYSRRAWPFSSAAIVSPNHSAWKYLKKMVDRTVFCPYSEKVFPEFRTVDVQIEGEWKTAATPAPLSIRVIRRPVQSIPSRSLPTVLHPGEFGSVPRPDGELRPRIGPSWPGSMK